MAGRRTMAAGVWITRGAAHDPAPIAGATHMVEHLTLRRCGEHDRRSLALAVDRLGGEVDAWTSSELMGVSINTTVDALGDALDLLAEAVLTPTFEPEDVELERRVTHAELDLVADDPAERVEEVLLSAAHVLFSSSSPDCDYGIVFNEHKIIGFVAFNLSGQEIFL